MVALRSGQVGAFLARPDRRLVLLYGPDSGLVSERSQRLAALLAARDDPPGEMLRLDDADLETEPDRLSVELMTVPMFGGAKIVRATSGRRMNAAVRAVLDGAGDMAGALIVEAGELRPDDSLRSVFEKSAVAVAIACYPDEEGSLEGLIDEMVRAAGLSIAADARTELVSRLGADRALSRAEVEKLLIFVHGRPRIESEDVEAIVGDASASAIEQVVAAAAAGRVAEALSACDRAIAGGETGQSVLLAAERHFQRLHRIRAAVDAGRPVADQLRQMRPPLPPRARNDLEQQARIWTAAAALAAVRRIASAIKASRSSQGEEGLLAERLLMDIASLATSVSAGRQRR
jgi:DNA polymerase-3 subunit delta